MMGFKASFVFFFALTLVSTLVSGNAIESTTELYWKSKLGNLAMPEVLKSSLQLESDDKIAKDLPQFGHATNQFWYGPGYDGHHALSIVQEFNFLYAYANSRHHANPGHKSYPVFFLTYENLSTKGAKLKLHFREINDGRKFLPSYILKLLAIAPNKLQTTLNILSVNPKSIDAKTIAQMFSDCEKKDLRGEVIHCASSLNDMVDFITSSSNSTETKHMVVATQEENDTLMEYTIENAQQIGKDDSHTTVCHRMNNPFVVFFCHRISRTDAYNVSLVGDNGKKMNAIAVCHKDTSEWNPGHIAFRLLKIKPGSQPICHFLSGDAIVWLQNKNL